MGITINPILWIKFHVAVIVSMELERISAAYFILKTSCILEN